MYSKHICAGLLMLLGLASGTTACVGVDGEEFSEQWGDEGDLSAQGALDDELSAQDEGSAPVIAPREYPNCGILPCPDGTECRFDWDGEPQCTAPRGESCSTLDCGPYHYCQMTPAAAICVVGTSDTGTSDI